MTDKELLALAAKAAKYDVVEESDGGLPFTIKVDDDYFTWGPLTHGGDALRLAIELDLTIIQDTDDKVCAVHWSDINGVHVAWKDNKYAATRRAIVRAAAEIGKTL